MAWLGSLQRFPGTVSVPVHSTGVSMARILVVEDNNTLREGMTQVIQRMGHEALDAPNGKAGFAVWEKEKPDLVISDLKMDDMDGMQLLKAVLAKDPEALIMIVTAFGSIEKAVEAMQKGAYDFIPKPFPPDLFRSKITRALEFKDQRRKTERLVQENQMLRDDARQSAELEMIGQSTQMESVFERIRKIAPSDSTVHISGESGTGKELVARALHEHSHRKDGPFVKVNCSALAETLLESELFGHEKGSFTGASKTKLGRFELADGGTIFLDEIGDVSPTIQLKLLRVLQERQVERVGGEETIYVDVRVITATNKDLKKEITEGNFREDLYHRISVILIKVPALNERLDDIPILGAYFIEQICVEYGMPIKTLSENAIKALQALSWTGNIREFRNVIERLIILCGSEITESDVNAFAQPMK